MFGNIVMDTFKQSLQSPSPRHLSVRNSQRRRYSNVMCPPSPSFNTQGLKNSISEHDLKSPFLFPERKKVIHSPKSQRSSSASRSSSKVSSRRSSRAGRKSSEHGFSTVAVALLSVISPQAVDISAKEGVALRRSRYRPALSVSPRLSLHMLNEGGSRELVKSEEVIEVLSAATMAAPQTIFLGFLRCDDSSDSSYGFKREDQRLDKALAECSLIKNQDGLSQALLLRCMDNKPMYSFLHYAIFKDGSFCVKSCSSSPSKNISGHLAQVNGLVAELRAGSNRSEYGSYEELFAIQKSVTSSTDQGLSSNRHSGYIVTCFKLLDESYRQQSLEKTWLSWTGAREIYKYSPRTWNLRRITLHRHASMNGVVRTFAYILLCEFGNILHPSNTLQARDMCERLRARNCGHIALYQVQHCYSPSVPFASSNLMHRSSISCTGRAQYSHSLNSPSTTPTTSSNQSLPQQPSISPWSSPKSLAASAAVRRREMMRGYSQDVDSSHETSRRRTALLRMRDRSLGYDCEDALFLSSLNNSAATSAANLANSSPRGGTPSPTVSSINLTPPPRYINYPQHQFLPHHIMPQELV